LTSLPSYLKESDTPNSTPNSNGFNHHLPNEKMLKADICGYPLFPNKAMWSYGVSLNGGSSCHHACFNTENGLVTWMMQGGTPMTLETSIHKILVAWLNPCSSSLFIPNNVGKTMP